MCQDISRNNNIGRKKYKKNTLTNSLQSTVSLLSKQIRNTHAVLVAEDNNIHEQEVEKMRRRIEELEKINEFQSKYIKDLEVLSDELKGKLSALELTNNSLMKLLSQPRPSISGNMQIVNKSFITQDIERLIKENWDLAAQLTEVKSAFNDTQAENKIVKRLLQGYRSMPSAMKKSSIIKSKSLVRGTQLKPSVSLTDCINRRTNKNLPETSKEVKLDRWCRLYQLVTEIANKENYKDVITAVVKYYFIKL